MGALTHMKHMTTNDPSIRMHPNMPSGDHLGTIKVSQYRLSGRMRQILLNIGDEIERGELLSRLYGFERNYCGYWNELCVYGKEKRDHLRRYGSAQAAMSRSLLRLQSRGLITTIKGGKGKVIKKIVLTETGKRIAQMLAISA